MGSMSRHVLNPDQFAFGMGPHFTDIAFPHVNGPVERAGMKDAAGLTGVSGRADLRYNEIVGARNSAIHTYRKWHQPVGNEPISEYRVQDDEQHPDTISKVTVGPKGAKHSASSRAWNGARMTWGGSYSGPTDVQSVRDYNESVVKPGQQARLF